MTDLVRALHATPQQAVIEVAGAGTLAVSWLHAVGGSSRTVLEATDRYCHASLAALLGAVPEPAVSVAVAAAMADAARRRARLLAGPGAPVVGAACTAALATDRPRRGADHAFVAVAGALGTAVSELAFPGAPVDAAGRLGRRDGQDRLSRLSVARRAGEPRPGSSRRWRSARCWWRNWPPCAESTLPACANVPGRRKRRRTVSFGHPMR